MRARVVSLDGLHDEGPPVAGGDRGQDPEAFPHDIQHGRAARVAHGEVLRVRGHVGAVVGNAHVAHHLRTKSCYVMQSQQLCAKP